MIRTVLALLVGTSAFAQGARLDPAKPEQAFQASRKLVASTRAGEASWYFWQGRAYSRVPGEKDRFLFSLLGMSVRTTRDVEDPKKGKGFQLLSREVMLFLDPATGAVLRHWDNPFSGQRVEVLPVANDPVNPPPSWEREPGNMGLIGTFHGGMYLHQVCVPLFYPDPLGGAFQQYVGGQYQALEVFNFAVPEEDLLDANRSGARNVTLSWMRVSKWMPWMAMGDRPGQLMFNAIGRRVERFEDLPTLLKQEIETNHPLFKVPPPLDDARPSETSWTTFKRHKEKTTPAH